MKPYILIIVIFAFFFYNCEDSITPPKINKPDTVSHSINWEIDTLGEFNSSLDAVWGNAPDDVWAAGWITKGNWGSNFVHYDGEKWEPANYFKARFYAMHGTSSDNIYAVGHNLSGLSLDALIAHYDGSKWKTVKEIAGMSHLTSVWAYDEKNVFATSSSGNVLRYNGKSWYVMVKLSNKWLTGIWGFAPDDLYVSGGISPSDIFQSKSLLYHYNGKKWTSLLDTTLNNYGEIYDVWGSSQDNMYFYGQYKEFSLYNGSITSGWTAQSVPDDYTMCNQIRGSSSNNIFQVGDFGIVVHYNGASWRNYPEILNKPNGPAFNDVMVFDDSVFIVGIEINLYRGIVYRGKLKK